MLLSIFSFVIGGFVFVFFFFPSSFSQKIVFSLRKVDQPVNINLKGDINKDGKVNEQDAELIKQATPCNHVNSCWSKVVGKTKDGDNPIYTSDLDLNHDDNVNELDISVLTSE